ncbi:hypothetical protein NPIL_391491, partial [Nephila pilipes]
RNINEIHTSLQRNKSWIEVADPQIAIKIRCIKEEDIPHAMEMRRQVGIHDVSSSVRSWMKIDPEGIKVAENENGITLTYIAEGFTVFMKNTET